MEAWLLGLILIVVCAIGVYYLNYSVSGIYDSSGTQMAEDTEGTEGTEGTRGIYDASGVEEVEGVEGFEDSDEQTCYNNYQACLAAGSDAAACAKIYNSCNVVKVPLEEAFTSESPESNFLTQVMKNIPSLPDASGAQIGQDIMAGYTALQNRIKPHQTPQNIPKPLSASLASDVGTAADEGQEIGLTLRSQIRNDINQAVQEEVDHIDNEYLIKYE